MTRAAAGLVVLLGLPANIAADGPVNPSTLSWIQPTTNTDGSPLTDLAGTVIRTAPTSTGPWTDRATVDAASPAPAPDTSASFDMRTLTLANGQHYAAVAAFDTSQTVGPQTAGLPFATSVTTGDTQAPVLLWGTPTTGKDRTVTVGAHDETALQTVKVFLNGALLTTGVTNLPDWQTTVTLGNSRSATVRIEATDAAGNLTAGSQVYRR